MAGRSAENVSGSVFRASHPQSTMKSRESFAGTWRVWRRKKRGVLKAESV